MFLHTVVKYKRDNLIFGFSKNMQCITAYLTRTLRAPRGVTNDAGANAYARKLAPSPTATVKRNK